jgi:hypothetical protein
MSEICPNCGYCPTCKRASSPSSEPATPWCPTSYDGCYCATCGAWVEIGQAHDRCLPANPAWRNTTIALTLTDWEKVLAAQS